MRKIILLIVILFLSNVYCSEMWKISMNNGISLSCTKLIKLENDLLYTEMLGNIQVFTVEDISSITIFKNNVNYVLVGGSLVGGITGLIFDSYVSGNNSIDIKRNGITGSTIGTITGMLVAHIFMLNDSIDLSNISIYEKNRIIESLILKV